MGARLECRQLERAQGLLPGEGKGDPSGTFGDTDAMLYPRRNQTFPSGVVLNTWVI